MTQEQGYDIPGQMMQESFEGAAKQNPRPTDDVDYDTGTTNPNIQTGRGPARTHFVNGIPVLAN